MSRLSAYEMYDYFFSNKEEKKIVELFKNSKEFITQKEITVFDVGCYRGVFSERLNSELKKVFDRAINYYLFDPNKNSKTLLSSHLNFIYNYYQLAFDDSNATKDFYLNTNIEPSGSSLQKIVLNDRWWNLSRKVMMGGMNKNYKIFKVQTKTIDDFCNENNISKIDILKIDTEGNEINVIKGATKMLGSCSIIFTEVLDQKKCFDAKLKQLEHMLNDNNFVLYDLKNIIFPSVFSDLKTADVLFVNKNIQ